jgi:carbamoyl-phosphate synthase large subunit
MNKINVLVTSAGGASAINVMQALRSQNEIPVRLIGVDMNATAAGLHLADAGYTVPKATESTFIPEVLKICKQEAVDVVVPILSVEMPVFAKRVDEFTCRGIDMLISRPEVIETCNDKWLTYSFFTETGVPTPQTWQPNQFPQKDKLPFPIIIKPNVGSGTRHTYRVENFEQVKALLPLVPSPILQEFIEGQEYTIDLLADRQSNLLAAIPRERVRTSGGKSVVAKTITDPEMLGWVKKIIKQIGLVGAANIQCFGNDDGLLFTEINARFAAGGLPLAVAVGANIPLMWLRMALGKFVEPIHFYKKDIVMSRYLTEVFLKLNETDDFVLFSK